MALAMDLHRLTSVVAVVVISSLVYIQDSTACKYKIMCECFVLPCDLSCYVVRPVVSQ